MTVLEEYWGRRQGFIIEPKDKTVDGCIVYEIIPFDGTCIYEPICIQNGFPFEAVRAYDNKYKGDLLAYIEVVSLNKKHRGKGIGSEMLKECIQDAQDKGVKAIFVIVSPEEELSFSMEDWIESKGFSVVSRSEDGVPLMVLEIDK